MKIQQPRSAGQSPLSRPAQSSPSGARPAPAQDGPAAAAARAQVVGPSVTSVDVSAANARLFEALAAVKAAPDVRADKVADARRRLADGTYTIDPQAIAARMLDSRR